ncbi:MAG: UDP-N-acetylmuramoyl-tripeptide--D-alanyl-D-alanine ligase [Ferruginibacter sp.]|nr:UDP-N-acetylmuramoyl-tripeptide--D-alanyl-D-alanine ligase [Ferruginibacter sp.]
MDITELYELYLQHPSVETDTRKIKRGDLFFALKGVNFNGNHYAQAALDAGASFCIVDEATGHVNEKIIRVNDSLQTLQQLAKKHREQFTIPFIAITGSNGKTTTKELIHAVLSSTYKTYTTSGNLNNHIGVPLTILKIKKDAAFAVIEMGANHLREIEGYCTYTLPTHGLITNCGKAHLEGFGGEANIKKGKGELYDHLRKHNGCAFVLWDYDYLREMSAGIPHLIKYGTSNDEVAFAGQIKNQTGFLEVVISKGAAIKEIKTQLVGGYNLPNVLAAVAVGKTFSIGEDQIRSALQNYTPSNSRSQLIEKGSNKIILDAYNANPSSMKVAVENFAVMSGAKKILILGGMMELGAESLEEHKKLVELIQQHNWQHIVLVGNDFKDLPKNIVHFNNVADAKEWYAQQEFNDSMLLIKGSRSMQMEKILD